MLCKNGWTLAEVRHSIPKVRLLIFVNRAGAHCGLWYWQVDLGSAFGNIPNSVSVRIDRSNIVRFWENDQ